MKVIVFLHLIFTLTVTGMCHSKAQRQVVVSKEIVELARQMPASVIYEKRDYIKEVLQVTVRKNSSAKYCAARELYTLLDTARKPTDINYSAIQEWIISLGTLGPGARGIKTQITDPVIFAILVAALKHEDRQIRGRAFTVLDSYGRKDYIYKFSEPIKQGLRKYDNFGARLIAFCKLNEDERKMLLNEYTLSLPIKAALGDTSAEDSLLRMYENVVDFDEKTKWVKKIAYVGTEKSTMFLLNELNDIQISPPRYKTTTIQIEILFHLSKNYPDEYVFWHDTPHIYNSCVKGSKMREYLNAVTATLQAKYHVDLNNLKNIEFLCKWVCRLNEQMFPFGVHGNRLVVGDADECRW